MQQRSTATAVALPFNIALALLAILVGGCSQSVELTSEYGPGVKFSETAHAYTWASAAARTSGEGRPDNANVDKLIREFVDAHLSRKGYGKLTGAGTPDFLIDYRVSKALRADPDDFTKPMYKEGTLEVFAIAPETSKLIWKGTVQTKLDPAATPAAIRERLDLIIGQLIDQIPSAKAK